jgi:anion-transporting  ArsA/GET3 family ATPase
MTALLNRKLIFVTGKGGVGKSTVAAALAMTAAQQGKKVLACEFDAKGDLLASFAGAGATGGRQGKPLTFAPREIQPNLYAMAMDPEESLKEYLKLNLRIPLITKVGALSTAFDFLANAAPGIREIVTVGKVAFEVREKHYDLVVVDATASGHIVGQLRAPQAINELVGVGAIRSQTGWMLDIFADPERCGVVITTTAHEMPVNETNDLIESLRRDTQVDIAGVVVNRLLPELLVASETKAFEALAASNLKGFRSELADPTAAEALIAGAQLARTQRRNEVVQLEALNKILRAHSIGQPALIPMLFDAVPGYETTRIVAEHLADEWGI